MNSYSAIDPDIRGWATRNSLHLLASSSPNESRVIFLSSTSRETFKIWIEVPKDGTVRVNAVAVEGRRELAPPETWVGEIAQLPSMLDSVLTTVVGWMKPAKRFFSGV